MWESPFGSIQNNHRYRFRVIVLLTLNLILVISNNSVQAQIKDKGKPSHTLCSRENALDIVRQQIDSSKLIEDTVKRIAVLLRAADAIWPYKEDSGRAAFSEAFDLAVMNFKEKGDDPRKEGLALLIETPDQRYVVLRAVAKRDPVWAKKMMEEMLKQEKQEAEENISRNTDRDARTAAKLLDSAGSLLSSDLNSAMMFARLSFRYPASFQLARFLYKFAETDQAAADQFYQDALTIYRDQPLSQFLYLSPYPFGSNRAAADMPVNAIYPVPTTFKPSSLLQRLFIQALLLRAQQAMVGKSDKNGFSGISDDGQIWLALTRLAPQVQGLGPELIATVDRTRNEIFALLSQDAQQAVTLSISNQDPPKRTLDEKLEAAERERNSDKRDQLIVAALLGVSNDEEPNKILNFAGRISDSKLRQQVLNWIYFTRTQILIEAKRFDEARALATEVEELDQRAFLYAEIATHSLSQIETQNQARETLDEIMEVSQKAPKTIITARTLLAIAYLYMKIDLEKSISTMGDAIKTINSLDGPDFSQQSLIRRIEGRNFARYASFQTPGLNLENAFRELAKLDFDDAMLQASSFSDKSLRGLTMLASIDPCLEELQREEKKKVKKGTSFSPEF